MLFVENMSRDPFYNQAFEEYVFEHADDDVLLLWRNGPAVVCGCYQNVYAEVDLIRARETGTAVVRRISGGGTVYHDEGNINYTFICVHDSDGVNYGRFIQPVAQALQSFGVEARMNRTCDIAVDGLKVSGNAQKIAKNRVLHHGTLLYDTNLTALRELTRGRREKFLSKGIQSSPWPVTNIRSHMPSGSPDTDEFFHLLRKKLAPEAADVRLTEAEMENARRLAETKYRTWAWTCAKSPAFECQTDFLLGEMPVSLRYEARKGVIETLSFSPCLPVLCAAREKLLNAPLEIDEVKARLDSLDGLDKLFRIFF